MSTKGKRQDTLWVPQTHTTTSTTTLAPTHVWDATTGEEMSLDEYEGLAKGVLDACLTMTNAIIREYAPQRLKPDGKGTSKKWARETLKPPDGVNLPDGYIYKYETLMTCQIRAAEVLSGHWLRGTIDLAIRGLTTDERNLAASDKRKRKQLLKRLKDEKLVPKGTNHLLFSNIMNATINALAEGRDETFGVPVVSNFDLRLSDFSPYVANQFVFRDIILDYRVGLGDRKVALVFDAEPLWRQYPQAAHVSKPAIGVHGGRLVHSFSVDELVAREEWHARHFLACDRNCDSTRDGGIQPITLSRVNIDGSCSNAKGPVREVSSLVRKRREQQRRRKDLVGKLGRLMPWQDEKRAALESDLARLDAAIVRTRELIDDLLVVSILGHAYPDELVFVEDLHGFCSPARLRNGETSSRLEHMSTRCGYNVMSVNPAYTSSVCPSCGSRLVSSGGRVARCPNGRCSHGSYDHDRLAPANIALRGMGTGLVSGCVEAAGGGVPSGVDAPDLAREGARSVLRRGARLAKMRRRHKAKKRVYHVKDEPTPSRPSPVWLGVRRARRGVGAGDVFSGFSGVFSGDGVRVDGFLSDGFSVGASSVPSGGGSGVSTAAGSHVPAVGSDHVIDDALSAMLLPVRNARRPSAWASSNVLSGGYGTVTSNAYINELRVKHEAKKKQADRQARRRSKAVAPQNELVRPEIVVI